MMINAYTKRFILSMLPLFYVKAFRKRILYIRVPLSIICFKAYAKAGAKYLPMCFYCLVSPSSNL